MAESGDARALEVADVKAALSVCEGTRKSPERLPVFRLDDDGRMVVRVRELRFAMVNGAVVEPADERLKGGGDSLVV